MRALTHARVVQPLCSDSGQAPNPHSNYRGPCSDVRERMHSVARARAWRFCAPSGSFCSPQLAKRNPPGGAPRAKPRRPDGAPGARRAPQPQRGRGRVGRLPAEMPAGDVGAAMLWWCTPGRVHTAAWGKNASAAARPHTPAAPPENFKWSIQRENLKYIIALAAGDALVYYYAARLRRIRVRPPAWSPSRSSKHIDWRPSAPARLRSK